MARPRPDILPYHLYWVLFGAQLLATTPQILPLNGPATILLFLFTITSMLLRWRIPLPQVTLVIDSLIVGAIALLHPINTVFLPVYVFHFCFYNKPLYTVPAVVVLCIFGTPYAMNLLFMAVLLGYVLHFWQRQQQSLQSEVDSFRQQVHDRELTEEHLLDDQYAIERVSKLTERQRIAEILHDTLGHELTAAQLTVKASGTLMNQGLIDQAMAMQQKTEYRLGEALNHLKATVRQIEPEEKTDIRRLNQLVENFSYPVEFRHSGDISHISPAIQQLLYVSVKEALTNIVKHANPTKVTLQLEATGVIIRVLIENDGVDKDQPIQSGSGLRYMRKRVEAIRGSLSIQLTDTFRLIIILPLQE